MSNRLQIGLGVILIAAGSVFLMLRLLPAESQRDEGLSVLLVQASNGGMALTEADGDVYVYSPESPGHQVAQGKIAKPLSVPPGSWDVRIRYSASRDQQTLWLRDLDLVAGEQTARKVEFAAGELNVEASVGSAESEAGEIVVYIYRPGIYEEIVTTMASGEPILLGAGVYDLRVVWVVDTEEKDTRWFYQVQVKTGLQSKLRVPFDRGVLNITPKNKGLAMAAGTVALSVYKAGDKQRKPVDSGMAGVPMGLASGRYDLKATYTGSSDRPVRWLKDIEIGDGEYVENAVEFSSGSLIVKAELAGGEVLGPYDVYVYYYRVDEHQQAVTYTPAGKPTVLESGQYDARAHFFRSNDQPDIWLRNIKVSSGEVGTHKVSFPSGRLLLRAYDKAGTELIGDSVFVSVYSASQHRHPIAKARSGEFITLTKGLYDLRAVDSSSGSEIRWRKNVRLEAGATLEETVIF